MQSVLLIENPQLAHDDISQALAGHFVLQRVRDISLARALLQRGQLVIVVVADIHDDERICYLRELVVSAHKVIVILPSMHHALLRACALLGAKGLIENDCHADVFMRYVGIVLNGKQTYSAEFLSKALDFYYKNFPPLSRSHMRILNALLQHPAANNADIARFVSLSEGTVRNIFTKLLRKFNVSLRVELRDEVIRRGYFMGFHLIFPRWFNIHADEVSIVDGEVVSRFSA